MITKELFGTCSAGTVDAYTLKNANGTYATILTMGGIIQKFVKDGIDICLGYDTLEEYLAGSAYTRPPCRLFLPLLAARV